MRQGGSGASGPGPLAPRSLRPAVDVRGRAYARFLAELDGRLDRLHLELERLTRELAAAEKRLEDDAQRLHETVSVFPATAGAALDEAAAHLLFVPASSGYSLLAQPGPVPAQGAVVDLPELGRVFLVTKLGPAPLPGDTRRCAYLLG